MQLETALSSLARSPFGAIVRSVLRFFRLSGPAREVFDSIQETLAVKRGSYTVEVGQTKAHFRVERNEAVRRLRSMTEFAVLQDVADRIRQTDVFFDIGANCGVYTCVIGQQVDPGNTVAFEPHPRNFRELQHNVRLNGLSVRALQFALSDSRGTVDLAVAVNSHHTHPGHNVIEITDQLREYGKAAWERVAVDMDAGDSLMERENLPCPNVMKIDVEGAELNVLQGFKRTLASEQCRLVYCELHPRHLHKFSSSTNDIYDFLRDLGYETKVIVEEKDKEHIRAERPS